MLTLLISRALAQDPALVVDIEGGRNDKGVVACQIFTGADGFPDDTQHAVATAMAVLKEGRGTCTFAAVPAGPFAVATMHDEDVDMALDRNFFGIPTEGYAFSHDALGFLGTPPSYEAARVAAIPADHHLKVHLVY